MRDGDVSVDGSGGVVVRPHGSAMGTRPIADDLADPFALPGDEPPRPSRARRPRTVRHAHRTAWLHLRVLPSERLRLTGAAGRAGYRNTSSWARGTLLAASQGESLPVLDATATGELVRLRRDLNSGVGANLNQAVAHANARAKGGMPADEDALLHAVDAARAALEAVREDLARLLGPHGRA